MKKLNKQTMIGLGVALALIAVVYFFGPAMGIPEDLHAEFVAGVGSIAALGMAQLRKLLAQDENQNGTADVLESLTGTEDE